MPISLRDIKVGDLNNVSIMLISKFTRMLHADTGLVIKLRDPNIIMKVAEQAAQTDNPQLKILFQRLKLEIKNQLNSAIPNRAEVGSMMIHHDVYHKVKSRAEQRELRANARS